MSFLPADVSDPKQGRALQSTLETLCSLDSRVSTPEGILLSSSKLCVIGDFLLGLPTQRQKDEVYKPQGNLLTEEPRAQARAS